MDIQTGEGRGFNGKLIGIDQSVGVAVILSTEGKLRKSRLCLSCELRDGITVVAPVLEGLDSLEFRSARILSVGPGKGSIGRGEWSVIINRPLPGIGEPLLDAEHRVLGFVASQKPSVHDPAGINTILYPMSQLLSSAEKILQAGGDIQTGWLGVYLTDSPTPKGAGVLVNRVLVDSPAQRAGLQPDDILLKWNGKGIEDARQFIQLVQDTSIGSRVTMDLMRRGKAVSATAVIEARKQPERQENFGFSFPPVIPLRGAGAYQDAARSLQPLMGFEAISLTPQMADALQIPAQVGLLVLRVKESMPSSRAGIMAGDVIVSVDGQPMADPESFLTHIRSRGQGSRLAVRLVRKGVERSAVVEVPPSPSRKP